MFNVVMFYNKQLYALFEDMANLFEDGPIFPLAYKEWIDELYNKASWWVTYIVYERMNKIGHIYKNEKLKTIHLFIDKYDSSIKRMGICSSVDESDNGSYFGTLEYHTSVDRVRLRVNSHDINAVGAIKLILTSTTTQNKKSKTYYLFDYTYLYHTYENIRNILNKLRSDCKKYKVYNKDDLVKELEQMVKNKFDLHHTKKLVEKDNDGHVKIFGIYDTKNNLMEYYIRFPKIDAMVNFKGSALKSNELKSLQLEVKDGELHLCINSIKLCRAYFNPKQDTINEINCALRHMHQRV